MPNKTVAFTFVETPTFTRQIKELATDDELKVFQESIIAQPELGDVIQGTGGLRKARMAINGAGKSGSLRVIYLLIAEDKVYLILAYPKSTKDSLTKAEKNELKKLSQALKSSHQGGGRS
ncbi:type II toxin-antitoxin system RelE/ParE family toxin [Reinekea blandensis]|uniref:Addiction module toxin RelE n=1 Tax=Reinekea blandensis MED297 TaxID=314283 RepID=A4BJW3_9GAMM|nr:type II toxin-antitoxin system RelE/ParE family toxin [Reinekea blandensis]EAR07564.1 hypothetical protein MED297_00045 [Reinekea sp. MED297] [Reinekea blandensis MED297]